MKAKLAARRQSSPRGRAADPLGFNDELLSLSGRERSPRGQLLSPDQTHLLLVTVPRAAALDTDASAALLARVESEGARLPAGPGGPARLLAAGGPRFAAESAATVKHDVLVTMLTSFAALLAIFVVRFRSLRLLAVTFVTLAFGIVGGLVAVALVHGRIHALTFAFGSVLIGIATTTRCTCSTPPRFRRGLPPENVRWAGGLGLALAHHHPDGVRPKLFSKFGPRELAFAGAGIAVAFAATLLLSPWRSLGLQHLSRSHPDARARCRRAAAPRLGHRGVVIAVAAVCIPRLQFDGSCATWMPAAGDAASTGGRKRFGLQVPIPWWCAWSHRRGLRLSDRVARTRASQQRGDVSHVVSLSSFLPSLQSQMARRARLADLDVPAARASLTRVSGQLGFSEGAFDPFWREVESLRSGETPPIRLEDLDHTSLGALVRRLLRCSGSSCIVVTSFEPSRLAAVAELRRELPPETVVIDGGAARTHGIPRQLALLSGVGCC